MSTIRLLFKSLLAPTFFSFLLFVLVFASCNSKQKENQKWVDSVLQVCDSIEEDTLVYDIVDPEVSVSVDEYFIDFLYAFTHNSKFMTARASYPLTFVDGLGKEHTIRNERDMRTYYTPDNPEFFFMLLDDSNSIDDAFNIDVKDMSMYMVDFKSDIIKLLECKRTAGQWMLVNTDEMPLASFAFGDFMYFYDKFSTDSLFQRDHISQPLSISIPDEDDETIKIVGTIDAEQFCVFAPSLPQDNLLIIDNGLIKQDPKKVVMVKCGMGSGMMELLTFEHNNGTWNLTFLEQ